MRHNRQPGSSAEHYRACVPPNASVSMIGGAVWVPGAGRGRVRAAGLRGAEPGARGSVGISERQGMLLEPWTECWEGRGC